MFLLSQEILFYAYKKNFINIIEFVFNSFTLILENYFVIKYQFNCNRSSFFR